MIRALELDCSREEARITGFISDKLTAAGFSKAVLGLSGGIDSALVAALCARVLGPENVRAVILPYRTSNPDSEAHARLVIDQYGLAMDRFEITPMVEAIASAHPDITAGRLGNIMARCRMTYLYDQSAAFKGLVMGTSNRTETLLGYFTLFGDGAAAIKPIAHLYKCQVRALSRHVGVPDAIVDKAPSADLWAGQTDEGDLGFSYDTADQVLFLLTEQGLTTTEIATQGFDLAVVEAVKARVARNAFKLVPPLVLPNGPANGE